MNDVYLILLVLLTLLVIVIVVMVFRQQSTIASLQQQLWTAHDVFVKETQAIKTTQLMQTNHFQEDLHQNMSHQLAPLHQSLLSVSSMVGELQQLHHNVASLKQVLTKEKSKGLLGEVALEAMLASLLPSNMYSMQSTHPSFDNNKVDALISITTAHDTLYVPIDAKVPLSDYENYSKNPTAEHWNSFVKAVKTQAKSIKSKYIRPPYTSDFALMYVPFESLVVDLYQDHHLLHTIFQETKVYIVSPMTLHAFINVLLMSYKHHDLIVQSSVIIQHMSELTSSVDQTIEALLHLQKRTQDSAHTLTSTISYAESIKKHLKAIEVRKKMDSND